MTTTSNKLELEQQQLRREGSLLILTTPTPRPLWGVGLRGGMEEESRRIVVLGGWGWRFEGRSEARE